MEVRPRRAVTILLALGLLFQQTSILRAQEISGQIKIEPPYPEIKIIKVHKTTQDSCAEEQISKSLLVSAEGGLANAVLWLEGEFSAQGGPASSGEMYLLPEQVVTLDQKNCNFEPHVALIPPGGRLRVLNSDPLAHDVRAFDLASMLFRLDMDTQAKPAERSFEKPGIYTIRCGLHPWMHAFAVQAGHPFYAVSNGKGEFVLRDVPDGRHTLHIWHETLGQVEMPIEVSGPVQNFSYTFKNVPAGN